MGLRTCAEVQSKDCFMFSVLPKDFILHRKGGNINVQVQHKNRHMDVVKVVSECGLRLGRVRMTYLFVTAPGMSMFSMEAVPGCRQRQHFQALRGVYTKT